MKTKFFEIINQGGRIFQNFTQYTLNPNDYFVTESDQYIITENDIGRLDEVAFVKYGNRNYYRYIMLYNYLEDPFNDLKVGMNIRLPSIEDIKSYESAQRTYNKWSNITQEDNKLLDKASNSKWL